MQRAVESGALLKLDKCSLRGVRTREVDLLGFVRQAHPRRLTLDNVELVSGSFRAIFDYCSSMEAQLEELYCIDLWEPTLVYFEDPGHAEVTQMGYLLPPFPCRPQTRRTE